MLRFKIWKANGLPDKFGFQAPLGLSTKNPVQNRFILPAHNPSFSAMPAESKPFFGIIRKPISIMKTAVTIQNAVLILIMNTESFQFMNLQQKTTGSDHGGDLMTNRITRFIAKAGKSVTAYISLPVTIQNPLRI